ncbi:MAG: hypothetical protein V1856_02150 [Candidatus Liptonbacteria bacterium]
MEKANDVFFSRVFWILLILIILGLISISLWLDFLKANRLAPREDPGATVKPAFRGPVGEPFVIGPKEPPPGQ